MCGRTRVAMSRERVEQATGVQRHRWVDAERYRPSYNVQPGQWTPILHLDETATTPVVQVAKWGLVPSFTQPGEKPDHFKMFNARSETVDSKPIFSRLLRRQRCVVLAEGFYEWKGEAGGRKQPYYVSFGEGQVMKMAGLYDTWAGGEEGPLTTYTILTCDSAPKLSWLHNRMPVLLPDDAAVAAWLGSSLQQQQEGGDAEAAAAGKGTHAAEADAPASDKEAAEEQMQEGRAAGKAAGGEAAAAPSALSPFVSLQKVCTPCNSDALQWHPVTPEMSKPSYNCPDCSRDVRSKKGTISSFFKPVAKSPAKQQQQQQVKPEVKPEGRKQPGGGSVTVRNTDDQPGPSAGDNAAAAAAGPAAGGGLKGAAAGSIGGKRAAEVQAGSSKKARVHADQT